MTPSTCSLSAALRLFFGVTAMSAVLARPAATQEPVGVRQIREYSAAAIHIGTATALLSWKEHLFVTDIMDKRVVRINRSTGAVDYVGRPGPGPGEFERPWALGTLGDSLWVLDSPRGRISFFGMDASHIRSIALAVPVLFAVPLRDGSLLYIPAPTQPPQLAAQTAQAIAVIRRTFEGPRVYDDTLLAIPTEQPSVRFRVGNLTRMMPRPLPFKTLFAAMPNGTGLVAVQQLPDTGAVIIHRVTAAGAEPALRLRVNTRPVLASDVDRFVSAIADGVRESLGRMRLDPASHRFRESDIEDALRLPSKYPPVSGVAVDRDGHFWLRREALAVSEIAVWQKYASETAAVAAIAVPAACQQVYIESMSQMACALFDDETGWSISLFTW